MVASSNGVAYRYQGSSRIFRFFTTPKLPEAVNKIAIIVEDLVGNRTVAIEVSKPLDFFPESPTNFKAVYNSGPKTVTLTWIDPTNSDLNSLRIFDNGGNGDPVPDYEFEIGTVSPGVQTFTTVALADGDYVFGIRALDTIGNLDENVDVLTRINVPNAAIPFPIGFQSLIEDEGEDEIVLIGIPLTDGKVKLEWEYFQDKENAIVTQFKVFTDNGTGIIDFATAIGTVARNSDTSNFTHTFTSAKLTSAAKKKFKFSVRAETSAGVDDKNTDFIEVELFGQTPMPVEQVSGQAIRALNSENGILDAEDLIGDDFDFEYEKEFA